MDIKITSVYGEIGIQSKKPSLSIKQSLPRAHIEQPPAVLTISNKLPKVYIDQTQCFAESGLKTSLALARDFNAEGLKAGIEYIGQISQEGDRLMRIENGGDPIVDIAADKMLAENEFNIVSMPMSRPDIKVDEGRADIVVLPKSPTIDWDVRTKAQIEAETYPKADIYIKTWPDIKFEYVGKNIDLKV